MHRVNSFLSKFSLAKQNASVTNHKLFICDGAHTYTYIKELLNYEYHINCRSSRKVHKHEL